MTELSDGVTQQAQESGERQGQGVAVDSGGGGSSVPGDLGVVAAACNSSLTTSISSSNCGKNSDVGVVDAGGGSGGGRELLAEGCYSSSSGGVLISLDPARLTALKLTIVQDQGVGGGGGESSSEARGDKKNIFILGALSG